MRILQTFLLPDELVAKYKLSFAAANFSRNLKSGGGFDKLYSLMPLTVKDELPRLTDDAYEVVYSNWRKKGSILSRFAIFQEQWYIFKQIKKKDSLWLYNLNIINALLFVLIKLFKTSVKLNIIVLDFTPANNWRKQNYWYLKLINKADGLICLADSPLFRVKNSALLPGVVPPTSEENPKIDNPNKEFLLSGVISPVIASTPMVLEAFSELPDCVLHITGNVLEGEELIKEYAAKFPNINYHGSVSFKCYLNIMHNVTYQLSTRDESYPENQCNFPSKIIETLLHNRIVISTIAYKQLDGIKYFKVDSSSELFKKQIENICNLPTEEQLQYANQTEDVQEMFSTKVWNKIMADIENNN
ncbi:glycosyltransferase family 4 protein [Flammeovirga sp. MY04]|uniref:hypothetical protein n=1 Tax=Flammeovirga sp. MY04 TaxID=1191459 RepID=UPI000806143A|nr:hypothetical protein [Flammeovirga sp. MY04]ANQ47870.1 glycosyltransferase family 4 protein [Flammeovirga sp. MY04]